MFERVIDIVILVASCALAFILIRPGVKRLIEGPSAELLDSIETVTVFDSAGFAITRIILGLAVMLAGQALRGKLR